jgi:hypothetical protein
MVFRKAFALFSAALVLACAIPAASDNVQATVRGVVKAQRIGARYGFMGMDLKLEVGGSTETIELGPDTPGVIYVAAVAPEELTSTVERLQQTAIPAAPTRFLTHITPGYAVVVGLAEIPAGVTVRLTLDDTELLYSPEPMRERLRLYSEATVTMILTAQNAYQADNQRYGTFHDLASGRHMYLDHRFAVDGDEVMLPDIGLVIRLFDVSDNCYLVEARNEEYGITVKLNETGQIVVLLDPDWP